MPNYPYFNTPYNNPSFASYGSVQGNYNNVPPNQAQSQTGGNNGIIWVQGEAGAKSYLVGAGNSVLLMDSEQSRFYIKSTDNSGMPMPLRIFEYKELSADVKSEQSSYVTHEELERRLKEFRRPDVREAKVSEKSTL